MHALCEVIGGNSSMTPGTFRKQTCLIHTFKLRKNSFLTVFSGLENLEGKNLVLMGVGLVKI